jgi:carboxylate-amine ligase
VFDTPLTVERAAQLATYAQLLAAYHLAERPQAPARAVYLVNAYNRFEACRYGFNGVMVEPYAGRKKRIGDDIRETIAVLAPHAERLGAAPVLAELAEVVCQGRSDADDLRAYRGKTGALEDVVRASAAQWAGQVPAAT